MRGTSSLFCCFLSKKDQKVIFQREFEQKPIIIQQQFSKNVTFFMRCILSLFCSFLTKKRTEGEIFERNWTKAPYYTGALSLKCNVFYAWYIVFILLLKKKTKCEISESIWAKTPYNTATISLRCNVCYARGIAFILLFFFKDFRENLSKNPS